MTAIYQILAKNENLTLADWQELERKIKPFTRSFSLFIDIKDYKFHFYLLTPKDISSSLADQSHLFFKKITALPLPHHRLPHIFRLPKKNLFDLITYYQLRKKEQLNQLLITYHNFPWPFYLTTFFLGNSSSTFFTFSPPYHLLQLNFKNHHTFKLKKLPDFLNPDKIQTLLTFDSKLALAKVDLFPYLTKPAFFPVSSLDLAKHSLIVGQTGTGKSKLIQLIISQLLNFQSQPFHIILIDPHLRLAQQLHLNFPQRSQLIDFIHQTVPLLSSLHQPQTATELTILLFKTLLANQFNSYLQRLLRYTLFTLYTTQSASLTNLYKFLTDEEYKNQLTNKLPQDYQHLKHFFDTDFIKYQTAYYDITFMPLISLLEELNFLPSFTSSKSKLLPLDKTINTYPLTLFALDQLYLGNANSKLISGLIVQQIFLLAQKGGLTHPTLLIIDEAPLVENEALATILSQSRKFKLSMILSYQYLSQTKPNILESIKTNVYNYFIFKTSDNDAKLLTNLIELDLKNKTTNPIHQDRFRTQIITSLNPRQLLIRPFFENKFYPAFKAETIDIKNLFPSKDAS